MPKVPKIAKTTSLQHLCNISRKMWRMKFIFSPQINVTGFFKLLLLFQVCKKKTLWPLFYGWSSTASRLKPLQGGSLLLTTKSPEISSTHIIYLGRMKDWVGLEASQWFWTGDLWTLNPVRVVRHARVN